MAAFIDIIAACFDNKVTKIKELLFSPKSD